MPKIIKKVKEVLRKKSFWLPNSLGLKIEQEARKHSTSESVLMTYIVSNWFEQ